MKAAIITKGSEGGVYKRERGCDWARTRTGMRTVDVAKLRQIAMMRVECLKAPGGIGHDLLAAEILLCTEVGTLLV